MIKKIKKLSEKYFTEIVGIRRHIHQHPELSFQEFETSKYIKSILTDWNIEYTDGYVNTGIIAVVKGKNPNKKCIAIRADFDALPIDEENDIEYASVNKGIMHACGHDAHTSSMLGTLKILNHLKSEWEGTIKFIFQPAEEMIPGGAKQMIEEGVLDSPNVTNVFAQHVFPDLEVGKVGFKSGIYMASADELHVSIYGKGGHAALPSKYNNPIIAAAHLITKLDTHFINIKECPCVFAIGFFESKGSTNVIPNEVKLKGTFRAMNEEFRDNSHQKMLIISDQISKQFDIQVNFDIKKGYPSLFNDTKLTNKSFEIAKEFLGSENVVTLPIRMTAEDFSYFSIERPSCFYRLGTRNKDKGIVHGLHTSKFNLDENALNTGMGLMAYIAFKELKNKST